MIETSSTRHKNIIRYQGVLEGRRELGNLYFIHWIKPPPIQHERAAPKLNPKVVVTG